MITSLRGMQDLTGQRAAVFERVVKCASQIASRYGFEFCELPKLEESGLFRRSVGESSDIVGKEMYEFLDKGGNSVCLRPEGTAGAVRAFVEAKFDRAGGVKRWFYYGSMFRYERPQKGRLREFHQFGVECFGEASELEDVAVILMASEILRELGIEANLKLNSLGTQESMRRYKAALDEFLSGSGEVLCEDCQRRRSTNIIRVLDCKNESCQKVIANAPVILDFLSDAERAEFERVCAVLKNAKIEFEIDPHLVRGLDYYTKTAFEFQSSQIGAKSAVIGGGRYDGLVECLGGRATAAVGWAMGVERICEILALKECEKSGPDAFVCAMDAEFLDEAFLLAQGLRKEFKTQVSYEAKGAQKLLAAADKLSAEWFVCLAANEAKEGKVWVKNLRTQEQWRVAKDEISNLILKERE